MSLLLALAGGGGPSNWTQSISDSITLSDDLVKSVGQTKADTITLSDSQSKSAGIYLSDSISISDSIAKALGLGESDTITLQDLISVPGSAVAYSFTLSDSIELSDTTVEVLVQGEAVDVFPAQIDGFSVYYGGSVHQLCVVAESDAPSGMGGVLKIRRNGITYAIYLVDVTDPAASHLRIKTSTAIKAIRLKA
jgi:hypothetical protein